MNRTPMDDILELVGMAEVRRRAEAYDALVAACRATLDRLSAWTDGAKVAQVAAETRQDRHEAEGFYNTVQNYTALMDRLRDALAAAGEGTEPQAMSDPLPLLDGTI